jgi:hypothetical protein
MFKMHQPSIKSAVLFVFILLLGCGPALAQSCPVRFAVIGDYGSARRAEADVAGLVKGWEPDLIITTGDNNYEDGAAATIDQNVGQFYHDFIFPYKGRYGDGASVNRFFPALGNHDWQTAGARPYLDYFSLPGNGRYYDYSWGPVHFFVLDSDPSEPDGVTSTSAQANWLRERLAAATEPWKLVYFHHSPYSSGLEHGSTAYMQWPFRAWGASAVLSGHDHDYERILRDGIPYFVNGAGGRSLYPFWIFHVAGSQVRYNDDYGAMLIEASASSIVYQFVSRDGSVVDTYKVAASNIHTPAPPPGLIVTAITKKEIDLAWASGDCYSDGFKVEQSLDGEHFSEVASVGLAATGYRATGLARGTTYYFRVRAYNSAGDSAYSETVSATTKRKKGQ